MMLELEKVCITCFQQQDVQFLRIQGEQNSAAADVLKKHFWFTDNDLQQAMICHSCWNHVENFHKFYSSVEELHHTRSAALLVKTEPNLDTIHVEPVDGKVNVEGEPSESGTREPAAADDVFEPAGLEKALSKNNMLGPIQTEEQSHKDEEYIRSHVRYICVQCGLESMSFSMFSKHARETHDNKSVFLRCCNRKFYRKVRLLEHVVAVNSPDMFHCDYCDEHYGGRAELRAHVRKHHNQQHKEHLFLQSMASEQRMTAKENELESLVVNSEPQLQETQQEPTASPLDNENISQVDSHPMEENSKHVVDDNSSKLVPCVGQPISKNKKKARRALRLEQQWKDDQYIRKHVKCICEQCGHESTTFSLFLRHAQEMHSNSSAYLTCCRKKFFRKSLLFEHVLAVNNPDMFRCTHCQKSLGRKTALQKHILKLHGTIQQKLPKQSPEQGKTSDGNGLVSVIVKSEPRLDDQLVLPAGEFTIKSEPKETFDVANENVECSVEIEDRFEDHHESEFVQSDDDDQHDPDVALGTATMNRLYAERQKRLELSQDTDKYIRQHVKYLCELCGLESVSFTRHLNHALEGHGIKSACVSCCGKKYYNRIRLLEHVQVVNDPSLFRCKRCGKSYNNKLGLLVHAKSTCAYIKSNPKEAQDIDMSMIIDSQRQERLKHSKSIDEYIRRHVKYLCEHCGLESESFARFLKHNQVNHTIKNAYVVCCGKRYHTRIRLLEHVQFIDNPEVFRCDRCDMNFDRRLGLVKHANHFHTGNAAKDNAMMKIYGKRLKHLKQTRNEEEFIKGHVKYLCEECGLESESFFQFIKHSRVFHKNNSPFLLCCGKKFFRQIRLLEHVRDINNPKKLRCGQCDQTFIYKIGLRLHTKKFHSVKEEKPAEVPDVLNKQRSSQWKKRLEISQRDEELIKQHVKYICKQCGLETETFTHFLNHEIEVHGNRSPYLACCGRRFRTRITLLEHVQVVNNPDLFHCDLCGKKFNQKMGLLVHTKEFHNASMEALRKMEDDYIKEHVQYICQICGHESPSFILFRKHSIEEHGNYSAFIMCCGKKFTRRLELLTHVQTLNHSNPFRCDACKINFSTALELQTHNKECHEPNTFVDTNTKSDEDCEKNMVL